MSGGRATLSSRRGVQMKAAAGDITCIDAMGFAFAEEFFVECKHFQSLEIHRWVYGAKTPLAEVWDKPLAQARAHDKEPFVIAKQDRQPEILLLSNMGYQNLRMSLRGPFSKLPRRATIYRDDDDLMTLHVVDFQTMLIRCSYDKLQRVIATRDRVRL